MNKSNKMWLLMFTAQILFYQCSLLIGPDPKNTPVNNFEIFWKDFDHHYALFEVKHVNWDSLYHVYRPQVSDNISDKQLFDILSNLIAPLNDRHITLKGIGKKYVSGSNSNEKINPYSLRIIKRKYLKTYSIAGNGFFIYGHLNDSTGYVHISSFNNTEGGFANNVNDWAKDIEKIVKTFSNTHRLIIDVRGNGGGSPANCEHIASRFFDQKRGYLYTRYRNGPKHDDLTEAHLSSINPDGSFHFKGEIKLLTSGNTASAAERFALAMKVLPYVTQVGDTTRGIFASQIERDLLNGWLYSITHSIQTSTDNICYEGKGIPPNLYVVNSDNDIANQIDNVLEAALNSF